MLVWVSRPTSPNLRHPRSVLIGDLLIEKDKLCASPRLPHEARMLYTDDRLKVFKVQALFVEEIAIGYRI